MGININTATLLPPTETKNTTTPNYEIIEQKYNDFLALNLVEHDSKKQLSKTISGIEERRDPVCFN